MVYYPGSIEVGLKRTKKNHHSDNSGNEKNHIPVTHGEKLLPSVLGKRSLIFLSCCSPYVLPEAETHTSADTRVQAVAGRGPRP